MSQSPRHIAHFDLDSFFVSVEILNDPSLKGKPVVVGGSERGVVAACSYEARKFGIHSAMPMKTAMRLCPQAIVVKGTRGEYTRYSRLVTDIIADKVPVYEKASIDEFYIDLTGMDKFFGVSTYTRQLRETITNETGLPISFGLSTSKLVSKMATNEAKPNGWLEIPAGKEKDFLWPLAVEKIPGVGKQTELQLKQMGLHTIADIAATPVQEMEKNFGKWGISLWNKSFGRDDNPVENFNEQKSVSRETTFNEDSTDLAFLHQQLVWLTEKAAYDLRLENKLCGCLTIKIRYAGFDTTSRQETIDYTALDDQLITKAKDIMSKLLQKNRPVRLLGVRFSQLIPVTMQMSLFEKAGEKMQLFKAVDTIKDKYGNQMITKAVNTSGPSTHKKTN